MVKPYYCLRILGLLCVLSCWLTPLHATHNRSGEIVVEQLICSDPMANPLTVKVTILTYTKTSSTQADRDTLNLNFGDGIEMRVGRINGAGTPPNGDPLENDVKKNIYCAFHTYPAFGSYVITMLDRNRNGGILNFNNTMTINIPFFLQTTYQIVNPALQGCNSTPTLNQPPLDFGCVGAVFTHNPLAIDPDGDSLSYHFTVPLQEVNTEVPLYVFPNQIGNGILTLDVVTGDIVWDSPAVAGEYNLAIHIVEYRNGVPIDTILRDMQILVLDCDNDPPTVDIERAEYCVIAGSVLEFPVVAGAPVTDEDQLVRLTANGAPFTLENSPATFTPVSTDFSDDPLTKIFRWQTTCDHIENQYYTVIFRAVDNFLGDTSGLATLKSVRIRVVGPPPQDVQAEPETATSILVSWQLPYACEETDDDYFRGFTVWRRNSSNQFSIDTCVTGLEGRGYTKISGPLPILVAEDGRYIFRDMDVERGRTYCYRILAEFARRTDNGFFLYNRVSSLPSQEVCVQVGRDIPLLTNVDVFTTAATTGEIEVCWSKPNPADLDTLTNVGPYRYELYQAVGQTTATEDFATLVASFESATFSAANDTCFTDSGLNTLTNPYSYLLRFYANNELIGEANAATSIFLTTAPSDSAVLLTWSEDVPWENYLYTVFRRDPGATVFDSVGITTMQTYRDPGLLNGEEYCYYVLSTGTYGVDGLRDPLFNRSQQTCEIPFDNIPPCPPQLAVESICDRGVDCSDASQLFNTLSWPNPNTVCDDTDDVVGYRIYYAPLQGAEFTLVANLESADLLSFQHTPPTGIAGCYRITAYDENENESEFSNIVCVDNCPFYALPNAFTPNGDDQNDIYQPFDFCFIERVEFEVFNRWGELVFTTQDPNLNWDGTNEKGEELADGTYFYRCLVFERRVDGITRSTDVLSGYIELLRGRP